MDQDGSGIVTFEELVEGARADQEFQSRLRVMDIDLWRNLPVTPRWSWNSGFARGGAFSGTHDVQKRSF